MSIGQSAFMVIILCSSAVEAVELHSNNSQAVMLVTINGRSLTSDNTYTIPGYKSLEACEQSQAHVKKQISTETLTDSDGKLQTKRTFKYAETKCIEL